MNDGDAHELARLRSKAYGALAGGLTAAESSRLAALEEAARRSRDSRADGEVREPAEDPDSQPRAVRAAPRSAAWQQIALVILAALVPVAGIGGYLSAMEAGRSESLPGVTSAPLLAAGDTVATFEDRRAVVLRAADWDGQRVTLLGAGEGVTVWWGTRGDETCAAVDLVQAGTSLVCGDTDDVRAEGLSAQTRFFHVTEAEESDPEAVDDAHAVATTVAFIGNPYTGRFIVVRRG